MPASSFLIRRWAGGLLLLALGASACKKEQGAQTQNPDDATDQSVDESLGEGSAQQAQVEALIAKQNYADAVALADELLATHPKDPGLYYAKAAALGRLGQTDQALAELSRSVEVDAKFVPSYVALAREYAFGRGDLTQGLSYAKTAFELEPKHPEAGLVLAMIQHDQGDKSAALATLEGLTSRGVKSPAVYTELGRIYAAKQNYDKARQALIAAIKAQAPEASVPTRLLLGRIELSANKLDAAKQAFDGALSAQPANPDIPLAIVRAYLRAEQGRLALPYAEKALQMAPDQAPALVAMARVQLAQGLIKGDQGALAWIDKALKAAPSSLAVQYAQALVLAGVGRCSQAQEIAGTLQGRLSASREQALKGKLKRCASK